MARYVYIVTCLLLAGLLCSQATPDEKVKAAKEQLQKAMADSDSAWIAYVNDYGAGSVMNLIAGPKSKDIPEPDRANTFKKNFKNALQAMDKLNKDAEAEGNDDVAFGINSHAHLDYDEFMALRATGVRSEPRASTRKARRTGPPPIPINRGAAVNPRPDGVTTQATTCTYTTGNSPYTLGGTAAATNVDWVKKGFVTPIQDQGQCGSCVAFATTVVTEWVLMQRSAAGLVNGKDKSYYTGSTTDLSEDDLMQCEGVAPWDGCNGAGLDDYFATASCVGQGTEKEFPYDAVDNFTCDASAERDAINAALRLQWAYVPFGSNADLMRAVTYAPTQIGVRVDNTWQNYRSGVLSCTTGTSKPTGRTGYTNHAVTVVGYGVAINGKPFYTIKNSWGTDWGEQGYIRVERNCTKKTPYGPFIMLYDNPIVPVL